MLPGDRRAARWARARGRGQPGAPALASALQLWPQSRVPWTRFMSQMAPLGARALQAAGRVRGSYGRSAVQGPAPCGQTGAARPEPACAPRGHRPHSILLGKPSTMPRFLRFRSGDWVTENSQNRMASFSTREREPRPLENFWKQSGVSGRPPGPRPRPRVSRA